MLDAIARFCGSREALAGPLKPFLRRQRYRLGMWLAIVIRAWEDRTLEPLRPQNPLQAVRAS